MSVLFLCCQGSDSATDSVDRESSDEVVDQIHQQEEQIGLGLLEENAQHRVLEGRVRSNVEEVQCGARICLDENYVQDYCNYDSHDPEDVAVYEASETFFSQKSVGNHRIDSAGDHKGVPEDGLDRDGDVCGIQCCCGSHEIEECRCEALERNISYEGLLEFSFLHEVDEGKQIHRD